MGSYYPPEAGACLTTSTPPCLHPKHTWGTWRTLCLPGVLPVGPSLRLQPQLNLADGQNPHPGPGPLLCAQSSVPTLLSSDP